MLHDLGGRQTTTISRPSHILLNFSSDLPQNPRPFNFILLNCLILPDKTIFKESGHALMKYWIFVNRKKVSIEFKFSNLMFLKMFSFLRVKNSANNRTLVNWNFFLVNYSKNHRNFPAGGSMGKMICRVVRNIFRFVFISRRLDITEAEEI